MPIARYFGHLMVLWAGLDEAQIRRLMMGLMMSLVGRHSPIKVVGAVYPTKWDENTLGMFRRVAERAGVHDFSFSVEMDLQDPRRVEETLSRVAGRLGEHEAMIVFLDETQMREIGKCGVRAGDIIALTYHQVSEEEGRSAEIFDRRLFDGMKIELDFPLPEGCQHGCVNCHCNKGDLVSAR